MERQPANKGSLRRAAGIAILVAFVMGGCSPAPASLGIASPSYLGAAQVSPPRATDAPAKPHVTSSKVLSAIVFERVTGLEVDPARLVQP